MAAVQEMARLQRLLFEVEREFIRTATTLIYRAGEPELKYLLCQHVWESAGHARFLRERGRELSGFGNGEGVRDSLRRVFNEAIMPDDGYVALAGFYRVLKPALLAAYRHYLRVTDHLANPGHDLPRERLWQVRAKKVVLATGAIERHMVFADNDRPGVMLASAARTYLNHYGVAVGKNVGVYTANDSAYAAAINLRKAGVNIAAIVDLRGSTDTYGREMQVTQVCVADEIAGAAELVMGKATGVPVAIVRGVDPEWLRESSVKDEIVRPPSEDLFR